MSTPDPDEAAWDDWRRPPQLLGVLLLAAAPPAGVLLALWLVQRALGA